jgi:hypothetical protein
MIRRPNSSAAFLALAVAFGAGCHAKRSADTRQQSPLTPVAQEIQGRGYHATESLIVPPTSWEASTLRMRSKRLFSFRADQRLPNERENYYCSFSLTEETYDSVDDARHRLATLHDDFRTLGGPVEDEYIRTMRIGFRVGVVAYVLQTGAAIFWPQVKRLTKELANATPGSELTHVIINKPPNKSLDASGGGVFRIIIGPAMLE